MSWLLYIIHSRGIFWQFSVEIIHWNGGQSECFLFSSADFYLTGAVCIMRGSAGIILQDFRSQSEQPGGAGRRFRGATAKEYETICTRLVMQASFAEIIPLQWTCSMCEEKENAHGHFHFIELFSFVSNLSTQHPLKCSELQKAHKTETQSVCIYIYSGIWEMAEMCIWFGKLGSRKMLGVPFQKGCAATYTLLIHRLKVFVAPL